MIRLLLCLFLLSHSIKGQVKPAYTLFNGEGKEVSHAKMIQQLTKADVVFFGELHNSSLAHWLQLQLLKELSATKKITLGMEMFESDDQIVLDEYLRGVIEEKNFIAEAKVWTNYNTDYKPLVSYAKQKGFRVIATNVPRRYANLVYRKGLTYLDSLDSESLKWIAPLPLLVDRELPGYKALSEGMAGHGPTGNLVESQALKDATMAHFVSTYLKEGELFYHINGSYHSQNREGIVHYLRKLKPRTTVVTIQVVEQANISSLEKSNLNKADYIYCIADDMTKTH